MKYSALWSCITLPSNNHYSSIFHNVCHHQYLSSIILSSLFFYFPLSLPAPASHPLSFPILRDKARHTAEAGNVGKDAYLPFT
jgi:hypothetical protein